MIRPMQVSDIPRVAEIHVFGWRMAYRGIVSDQHLFNNRLVSKSIDKFTQIINSDDTQNEMWGNNYVYDDGIIKAFLTIGPCRDEDKQDSYELGGLYVDPCFKDQGIGRMLAHHCEKIAKQEGFTEICIWTFEKNTPARVFYEKLGYAHDGVTQIVKPYNAIGVRYAKILNEK